MNKRCMGCMNEYSEEFEICPYCGFIDAIFNASLTRFLVSVLITFITSFPCSSLGIESRNPFI